MGPSLTRRSMLSLSGFVGVTKIWNIIGQVTTIANFICKALFSKFFEHIFAASAQRCSHTA